MFGWKRRALDAEARLARAEYHFDVQWLLVDGSVQWQKNVAVCDGTLDVWGLDADGYALPIARARVFVRKVVDGVLVGGTPERVDD